LCNKPTEYDIGPEYRTLQFNGRIKRMMSLAKKVAYNCEAEDYKHGAVLAKGGTVINTAFNKNRLCMCVEWARMGATGYPSLALCATLP
jgi:hypothetical protein